jgi:hypothetical protein
MWYMRRNWSSKEYLHGCEDRYGEKGKEKGEEDSLLIVINIHLIDKLRILTKGFAADASFVFFTPGFDFFAGFELAPVAGRQMIA